MSGQPSGAVRFNEHSIGPAALNLALNTVR